MTAIKLKDIKIVSNNGELMNENNSDIKIDYDPTQTLLMNSSCDVTYKQIFYQTVKFINNNNSKDKPYLQYPKLFLQCIKVKCNDKNNCIQCYNSIGNDDSDSNSNNSSSAVNPGHFVLCWTKRREIANQLYDSAREGICVTDSSTTTVAKLLIRDESLIKDSNDYTIHSNWFAKVYSYLKWQQEVINALLHNLVYFDNVSIDKKQNEMKQDEKAEIESVTTKGRIDDVNKSNEEEVRFFSKFDLLVSLHSYLDELIEYLVLYYCCFDETSWIAVFYPFIQNAIGTLECNMIFAESSGHSKQVISLCNEALMMNEKIKENIVKEMKAIRIFKRLIYNIYNEDEDEDGNDITDANPFDLTGRICIKLQENVNNIKTQLMIKKMTFKNDTANETNVNLERKESNADCIDNDDNDYSEANKAPSFIRLFVIRRIMSKYLRSSGNGKEKYERVKELANMCNDDENGDIISDVIDILSMLVMDGIKIYMNEWHRENEERDIIEIIFYKIILKKFKNEYNQLITYSCDDEMKKYQNKVFNSSDLMCLIFQYLEYGDYFDGDLFSCSLVHSCWLYHSWNVNALYSVHLGKIVRITQKCNTNYKSNILRMWQRLLHAKSIRIFRLPLDSDVIWKKMLLLRNIEELYAGFELNNDSDIARFKLLMKRYAPRLKTWQIKVSGSKFTENQLSTFKFPNARKIIIRNLFFYPLWSNKCEELVFSRKVNVSEKWCKFMIEHCDCSNIKIFALPYRIASSVNESILEQLVAKLTSVEQLEIHMSAKANDNTVLLWQLLNPILLKNHGKTELKMRDISGKDVNLLNETIKKHNLKVDMLNADISSGESNDIRDERIKFIQERDNDGLNHLKIGSWETSNSAPKTQLHKLLSFKFINVLQFETSLTTSIGYVMQLLELNDITKRQMVLIINAQVSISEMIDDTYNDDDENKLLPFNTLCRQIHILIEQKIPVDIRITFQDHDGRYFKQCIKTYLSLFNPKNVLNEYEQPRCNNALCVPRTKLYTFFDVSRNDKWCKLKVMNVEYV